MKEIWKPIKGFENRYEASNYEGTIPLKLSSGSHGTIYYTLDGSNPGTNSNKKRHKT